MNQRKKRGIVILCIFIVFLGSFFLMWKNLENQRKNFLSAKAAGNSYSIGFVKYPKEEYSQTIIGTDRENLRPYESVIFTSYRCRLFDKEEISWGFGTEPMELLYRTGSVLEVVTVLEKAFQGTKGIKMVFLELDPRKHNDERIVQQVEKHPETEFMIFFSPYPDEYWEKIKKNGGLTERIFSYEDLSEKLSYFENVSLFYFDGEPWMSQNPNFFLNGTELSKDAMHQIYSAFGAGRTFDFMGDFSPSMGTKDWMNLSGKTIFCFGDSMYAKDRGESGTLEVAAGFLKMDAYNAAISGSSAASEAPKDLEKVLDLFLNWEKEKEKLKSTQYKEAIPIETAKAMKDMQEIEPDYILLAYGYNDYSQQMIPQMREGEKTFSSMLSEQVRRLKERFPNATIILSTAVTSLSDLGGEYDLEEYAKAMQEVAKKEEVYCFYNYETGELIEENMDQFLVDHVHFNVLGRFKQGIRLAEFLESIENTKKDDETN